MGYQTEFEGTITIEPALNAEEIVYLNKFAETRRMDRENGPYFVDGYGYVGQGNGPDEIFHHSNPPAGQPGLWCQWVPTEDGDGTTLEWNGHEKFYEAAKWMQYLMDHFIGSTPAAKSVLPFLQGHVCNGAISAQGEEPSDMWLLEVKDNQVFVQDLVLTPSGESIPVATSKAKQLSAPAPKQLTRVAASDGKSVLPESGNG